MLTRWERLGATLAVLVGVASGLTGCGDDDTAEQGGSDTLRVPAVPAPGVRDELDALRGQLDEPEYAVENLIARCMTEKGFRYTAIPRERLRATPLPRLHGEDTEAQSARGFTPVEAGQGNDPGRVGGAVDSARMSDTEAEAYDLALNGPVEDYVEALDPVAGGQVGISGTGCRHDALAAVYGDIPQYLVANAFPANLFNAAANDAGSSDDASGLKRSWRSCIEEQPLPAQLPDSPASPGEFRSAVLDVVEKDPGLSLDQGFPLDLARRDAACQERVDYRRRMTDIEDRYLTAYLTRFEGEITAARELFSVARTNAARVLDT